MDTEKFDAAFAHITKEMVAQETAHPSKAWPNAAKSLIGKLKGGPRVAPGDTEQALLEDIRYKVVDKVGDVPNLKLEEFIQFPQLLPLLEAYVDANTQAIAIKQAPVDRLVAALPGAIAEGEAATVKWLDAFAEATDTTLVHYDKASIANQLTTAGYKRGDHVGDPKVRSDHSVQAKWMVGQVIAELQGDHRPDLRNVPGQVAHYNNMRDEAMGITPEPLARGGTQVTSSPQRGAGINS